MRKLSAVLCILALFAFVSGAMAQFGNKVADTPHNLRKATTDGMPVEDYGEICVYCHTPHSANTNIDAPLWNRETPTGPYDMYSSPTIDMTMANSAQGVSLACLSCHDGSIALDQIINVPSSYSGQGPSGTTIETCATQCHIGNNPSGGINFEGTFIGTDLSNDHPISITYDPTKDPKFKAATNGMIDILPLYGPSKDQVECATCHNPHDNSTRPFLRKSNQDSQLCLTCHDI